ncbi:hypothetical protein JXQ31_09745 [candidate division KSB1 bacterium]|nr:hypothetical protein [candidate division KSB1 bacterium]
MDSELSIIKKYCGNIEERIKACKNRDIAEQLRCRLCFELGENCKSEIVINVLHEYVNKIINNTFDKKGRNKTLESDYETR